MLTKLFSRKDSPAVQRRSSSAVTGRHNSVAYRNSLPLTSSLAKEVTKDVTKTGHRSLERKRAGTLQKYSGSQSTSSIPRRVVKENNEKLQAIRKISDDSNSGDSVEDFGGPVTSILSFVDDMPGGGGGGGDRRKQSLIHGVEEFQVAERESRNNAKNESGVKIVVTKKKDVSKPAVKPRINESPVKAGILKQSDSSKGPTIKKPDPKKAPASRKGSAETAKTLPRVSNLKAKKPLKASVTAPLSQGDKAKSQGDVSKTQGGRQLRATKSATAPVTSSAALKRPVTNQRSAGGSSANQNTASSPAPASTPIRAGQKPSPAQNSTLSKGKKTPYPKKVSSEYPSEIVFKNQEGLKFSSVNFFESEDEAGQTR